MARQYLLTRIEHDVGTLNLTRIHRIYWLDLEDLEEYVTVVDESYRNFTRSGWHTLCLDSTTPYGIYTGLVRTRRRTRAGVRVVSADSYPQRIEPLTRDDVIARIESKIVKLETRE
jgi:hypothetical protein